jgi:hypothetical protein
LRLGQLGTGTQRWPRWHTLEAIHKSCNIMALWTMLAECVFRLDCFFGLADATSCGPGTAWCVTQPHSYLSATTGSTRVARRAGTKHASNVTVSNNNVTQRNVTGSAAFTPNSKSFA